MTEQKLNQDGKNRIKQVLIGMIILSAILFVSAGRIDWVWGWVYVGIYTISLLINAIMALRVNPEVINQRGRKPENQPEWDKTLMKVYTPFVFASPIVAGLDARFGWSEVPLWLHLVAIPLGLLAYLIISRAMAHNPFLAQQVAVQTEAGHKVATTGPYNVVRHPMYISMILSQLISPLILGSWWMFIPGTLSALIITVRTALEDRTLQEELDGYKEYAGQVKYRLIPGIW